MRNSLARSFTIAAVTVAGTLGATAIDTRAAPVAPPPGVATTGAPTPTAPTAGAPTLHAPAGVQAPFALADVMGAAFPSNLVASPDGDAVAFVLDERGARNLWVATAPEWTGRRLTDFREDDGQEIGNVQFTADGTTLVYVRGGAPNRQGELPNPLSQAEEPERAIFAIAVEGGEPTEVASGSGPIVAPDRHGLVFRSRGGLWWHGLDDGEPRLVVSPRGGIGAARFSPDGGRIAFVSNRGTHAFIGVVGLDGEGAVAWLDPSVDTDTNPAWSPDGRRIAFIRVPAGPRPAIFAPRREAEPWAIRVADAAGGPSRLVHRAGAGPGSVLQGVRGDTLMWSAGDALVFPSEINGWKGLYSVPAAGGAPRPVAAGEFEVEAANLHPNGADVLLTSNQRSIDRRGVWRAPSDGSAAAERLTDEAWIAWSPVVVRGGLAYLRADGVTPAHAVIHADGGEARALATAAVPDSFPSDRLVRPQAVVFPAADGMPIHGQLFLPSDRQPGQRLPAVLFFHGGSRRQMLLGFHYLGYYHNTYAMNQYLASRGFIVLSVNYRSGIGYGLEFREALEYGATGASEFNDVLGAGLYLRGRDDVDAARIGLWGGSYGGYLTALGLARASDLFAAGVDVHGVHDWNVVIRGFVPSYDPDPETERLAYESSPMASMSTWRSPVLAIHGDDDRNVPFSETVDLVAALRGRGVHIEQLVFPDEVHGFLLHANWLRAFEATAEFFDRMLGEADR